MSETSRYRVTRRSSSVRTPRGAIVPEARAREIVEAIRRWNERYGEPPTLADWEPSRARARGQEWRLERFEAGEWPTTRIVRYHFGTMSAAVAAAGLKGRRRPTRVRRHLRSSDSVLEAIRAWVERYGEPPAMADWDPQRSRRAGHWWRVARFYEGDWPSITTVRHHFGSLNAAIREAGYEPRPRGMHVRSSVEHEGRAAGPNDAAAAAVLLSVRAVGRAQKSTDHRALERALRDLSSACLNWADRLAA